MKASVYLIGATILIDKLNLQSFEYVENAFQARGFNTVKPHDLFADSEQKKLSDDQVINRRVKALDDCDFAVLISGWQEDRYALAEKSVADFRKKPTYSLLEGIDRITNKHIRS